MKKILATLATFLMFPVIILADTSSFYVQQTTYLKPFIRAGVVMASGDMEYTTPFEMVVENYKSNDKNLAVGLEVSMDETAGSRMYLDYKDGYRTVANTRTNTNELGLGLEGYIGNGRVNFLYGAIFGWGDSQNNLDYFAIEPYIGAEALVNDNISLYTKLGFQSRAYENYYMYDSFDYLVEVEQVSLAAAFSIGLQFKF